MFNSLDFNNNTKQLNMWSKVANPVEISLSDVPEALIQNDFNLLKPYVDTFDMKLGYLSTVKQIKKYYDKTKINFTLSNKLFNENEVILSIIVGFRGWSRKALVSIKSLLMNVIPNNVEIIIIEQQSTEIFDIQDSNNKNSKIKYYKIATNTDQWDRETVFNYGINKAEGRYVAIWDVCFLCNDKFVDKLLKYVKQVDFDKHIFSVAVYESHDNGGRTKYQGYGNMWVYNRNKVRNFVLNHSTLNKKLGLSILHSMYVDTSLYVIHMSHTKNNISERSQKNNINKIELLQHNNFLVINAITENIPEVFSYYEMIPVNYNILDIKIIEMYQHVPDPIHINVLSRTENGYEEKSLSSPDYSEIISNNIANNIINIGLNNYTENIHDALIKIEDNDKNHYYNLKDNSCYYIKNNDNINVVLIVTDPNNNVIHSRKLSKINIIYTNISGLYKLTFMNEEEKIYNIKYKIEYLSKNNKSLLFKWEPMLIFVDKITTNFINILPKHEKIYLILFNSDTIDDTIDNIVKCYTIFSNIIQDDVESLNILLKARLGDSYPCYYFENDKLVRYQSYEFLTSNLKYKFSKFINKSNIASLATYPKRKDIINETIKSLTNQVDIINIFFNSYKISDVNKIVCNYNVSYIIDSLGDCRAAGKFFRAYTDNYNFICDDDIIYPPNYVANSIDCLKKYPNSIHSYMGVIFNEKIIEFPARKHRKQYVHFASEYNDISLVHLVGTGVMYYYGKNILAPFDVFLEHVCFNDDVLALYSKINKIPMYTVPKENKWLISNEDMEIGLYDEKEFDPVKFDVLKLYKDNNPWPDPNYYKIDYTTIFDKNPIVTIIIPLYNKELYIDRAIKSVLNQTYKFWELIIIDDKSTDGSYDIINKYKDYQNIRIYKMENNYGPYVCINIGIDLSKGKYICRLDADDTLNHNNLAITTDIFNKNPNIDVVKYHLDLNGRSHTGEITMLYKKDIIHKIGYYDSVRYAADSEFMDRLGKSGLKIFYINDILYTYHKVPKSLTDVNKLGSENRKKYVDSYMKWHNSKDNKYISFPLKYRLFDAPKSMMSMYPSDKMIALIQSYNRYDKLIRLINQIQEQSNIHIIIVDDCSNDLRYLNLSNIYNNITVLRNIENQGKIGYWKTVNNGLNICKTHDFEYILHFDDDIILSKYFFTLVNKNILENNFMLTFQIEKQQIKWAYNNWVDCCFISPHSFWKKINYQIDPISANRWKNNKNISSGVWKQITEKLNLYGYNVIFPDYSLCFHDGNDDSKLNFKLRNDNHLHTWRFYDDCNI